MEVGSGKSAFRSIRSVTVTLQFIYSLLPQTWPPAAASVL